ncbi:MAG: succinate-semialdehyde dehydrogenase [Bacteroidota bacterium]|jgi:succinate-semialdehyde dehydrogenase/glutarate-semialdehyde dehydrogenase
MDKLPISLQNTSLFKQQSFIDGKWKEGQDRLTFPVFNPYNKDKIADVSDLSIPDFEEAVQCAHKAFPTWSKLTSFDRSKILQNWNQLILENEYDLACILTLEQGKPIQEALGEIRYGASFIAWFAAEAMRIYGDLIPSPDGSKRISVLRQPIGVVVAITPWNFPNAMITRKIAPALAAGCTVLVKPAEDTPLSALALAALAQQAGMPNGVLNILPTSQPVLAGDYFCAHKSIQKISFTGSTQTGKYLMEKGAATLKKLSLELGGNAPFIVFEDANMEEAIQGAILSKYRNAGQTCVCTNRFIIQESILPIFLEKLAQAIDKMEMGDGFEEGVQIGPLINDKAIKKVHRMVNEALEKGAKIYYSKKNSNHPTVLSPIILTQVNSSMQLSKEEIFGPISAVTTFSTEEEAIFLANNTEFGLASYLYTKDNSRIHRVTEALEYGMVGVNTGIISYASAPFGGIKESGFGREGSKYGIDEYLILKYICTDIKG